MKDILIDWLGTFWKVLIVPKPQTFLAEAKKADGKFASALGWLIFLGIYLSALASFALARERLSIAVMLTFAVGIPFAVILATSTAHAICRRVFLRKEYLYDKMLYLAVAVLVPIFLIFPPLAIFIPGNIFAFLSFILLLYQVALLIIAIKTIVNIEYWQGLVIVFLSMLMGVLAFGTTFILIRATISAGIVNSSNISTPVK